MASFDIACSFHFEICYMRTLFWQKRYTLHIQLLQIELSCSLETLVPSQAWEIRALILNYLRSDTPGSSGGGEIKFPNLIFKSNLIRRYTETRTRSSALHLHQALATIIINFLSCKRYVILYKHSVRIQWSWLWSWSSYDIISNWGLLSFQLSPTCIQSWLLPQ